MEKTNCIICRQQAVVWVKIPINAYCVTCYGKHQDKDFGRYLSERKTNR